MSTQTYRDQVTRLVSEIAGLETKHAKAREDAARERSAAGRAMTSISRTSSASTIQSRLREAERHEARGATMDKEAARLATLIAAKQKARGDAERRLTSAEAADRKKLALEADRRRRDDLRHIADFDRARRATGGGASVGSVSAAMVAPEVTKTDKVDAMGADRRTPARGPGRPPWTAERFWARYRAAAASATPPLTYRAIASHFETLDGNVGTDPEYVRKLVRRFGLPADNVSE